MDSSKLQGEYTKVEHDYSSLQIPVALAIFVFWLACMFFSYRDIPNFQSGLWQTAGACSLAVFLSFQRSSAFRGAKWILPCVLMAALALGSWTGQHFIPKTELANRLDAEFTIEGLSLGMTRQAVAEKLSTTAKSDGQSVMDYGTVRVEFRDDKIIAVEGSRLEREGSPCLKLGDLGSSIPLTLTPLSRYRLILEHGTPKGRLRFDTSGETISRILLFQKDTGSFELQAKELSFE